MREPDWRAIVREEARVNHEENFSWRRGLYWMEEWNVIWVYSNHFYARFPTLLDREMKRLKERVEAMGYGQLGHATWPEGGLEDGYSCAVLFDAGPEAEESI